MVGPPCRRAAGGEISKTLASLSLYVSTNSVGLFIRGPRGMPSDVLADLLRPHLEELHHSLGNAMDAEE